MKRSKVLVLVMIVFSLIGLFSGGNMKAYAFTEEQSGHDPFCTESHIFGLTASGEENDIQVLAAPLMCEVHVMYEYPRLWVDNCYWYQIIEYRCQNCLYRQEVSRELVSTLHLFTPAGSVVNGVQLYECMLCGMVGRN